MSDEIKDTAEKESEEILKLKSWVITLVKMQSDNYQVELERMNKLLENIEEINAVLVNGYSELASLVETITAISLKDVDPEEFNKALTQSRKKMIEVLQHGMQQAQSQDEKFHPESNNTDADT